MKPSWTKSELFFVILGGILIVSTSLFLYFKHSFIPEPHPIDPFEAGYSSSVKPVVPAATPALSPSPTPTPKPTATPKPTQAALSQVSPTPSPTKQVVYLIQPKARALISMPQIEKKAAEVTFYFEVEPRNIKSTFVLSLGKTQVLEKSLKPSPTGSYQMRLKLTKKGKYTWQIKTAKHLSEKREFTLK